jgi:hypothetical protein
MAMAIPGFIAVFYAVVWIQGRRIRQREHWKAILHHDDSD